ncbi:DUF3857 domain-containing protein [Myxococcota bacterium]|nr:DUF3857 domain-containing protein [Myxococcota bacterium]
MQMFEAGFRLWPLMGVLGLIGCGGAWPALDTEAIRRDGDRLAPAEGWRIVSDEGVVTFSPGTATEALVTFEGRIVRHYVGPRVQHFTEHLTYDATTVSQAELRARLSNPGAPEKTLSDGDTHDMPVWWSDSVLDTRRRRLEISGIRPGSVLETRKVHAYRDAGIGPTHFWFDASVPVERARLEVRTPPGFDLEWEAYPPDFAPQTTDGPEGRVYVWTQNGLPARKAESHADPAGNDRVRVSYRLRSWPGGAPLRSAVEVSRWAAALNLPRAVPTPVIAAKVAEILGPSPPTDPGERARRLSDWVGRKVRYVAIELGIGGWQAQPAEFTLDRLYGDCKAKASLLAAMLSAAGVPNRLALIESSRTPARYVPFLGGANFNHMVLLVDLPGGPVLVDPTVPHVPFGDVPVTDQDKDVLPLTAAGAEATRQPATSAEHNGTRLRAEQVVAADGTTTAAFDYRARGAAADDLRQTLGPRTPEARRRWTAGWVPIDNLIVDEIDTQLLSAPEARLPVDLTGRGHGRYRLVLDGDTAALRVADLLWPCFPEPSRGKRRTPAALGAARQDDVELRLTLPPGWQARVPALPVAVKTPAGEYTLTLKAEADALTVQRRCRRDANVLTAAEYGRFRKLALAARAAEGVPIVLQKGTAPSVAPSHPVGGTK